MESTIKLLLRVSVAALFASAIVPLVISQQSRGSDSRAATDRVLRERQRQFTYLMLDKELRRPADQREQRLAFAQIREDYMRIQIVNNDLAQEVARGGTLDLNFVAKSASEIQKRAGRLKYNLVLPKPEEETKHANAKVVAETERLKSSLSALSGLIVGFVNNPVFKLSNVVDAQSSVKARRDLEQIIELSAWVKKSSEKLDKAAQKSN